MKEFITCKKIGIALFVFIHLSNFLFSQNRLSSTDNRVVYNQYLHTFEFKDSLENGVWEIVELERYRRFFFFQQETQKVRLRGEFLNGQRNGEFNYYSGSIKDGTYSISRTENYRNGKLHGKFVEFSPWSKNQVLFLGQYDEGEKDGIWISRKEAIIDSKHGYIIFKIEYFEKGELIYSQTYSD